MLREFSSIWIGRSVVLLSQQKSLWDERKLVDKNGILQQRSSWHDDCGYSRLRMGTPQLRAASGMMIETTMTRGQRYLSFHCTIKEFIMRVFSSIWISCAAVFLSQQTLYQDKSELVAADITDYIRVGIL